MKRTSLSCIVLAVIVLAVTGAAFAASVPISLALSDWKNAPYPDPDATAYLTQTVDGNLRGVKPSATGGSNWALNVQTVAGYDFQNATLRYKWLLNGMGTYSAIYSGVLDAAYVFDPNSPVAGHFSTGWSWAGSEVIASNTWLYTQVSFTETGYDYSVSYTGYGNNDFLYGSRALSTAAWETLADGHLWFRLVDNYGPGAYFEIAEASIERPDAPVPEPNTMVLLGLGVVGLFGLRKKVCKC